jgi:hypothetical protein
METHAETNERNNMSSACDHSGIKTVHWPELWGLWMPTERKWARTLSENGADIVPEVYRTLERARRAATHNAEQYDIKCEIRRITVGGPKESVQ